MARTKYLPLCGYMAQKIGGPRDLWTGFNCLAAELIGTVAHVPVAQDFDHAVTMAIAPNLAGLMAAIMLSNSILPPILNEKRIGLTRGGRIVRRTQLAAFAIPALFSVGLHFELAQIDLILHPPKPGNAVTETMPLLTNAKTPLRALALAPSPACL